MGEDNRISGKTIWERLEANHELMCNENPQYGILKSEIKSICDKLENGDLNKLIEYEVKMNTLLAIEVEAAYKQGYLDAVKKINTKNRI